MKELRPGTKFNTEPRVIGKPDFSANQTHPNVQAVPPAPDPALQQLKVEDEKNPATSRFETPSQFKPENRMYVPGHNPKILKKEIDNPVQKMLLGAGLEDMSQVHSLYKKQLKQVQEQTMNDKEPASKPKRQELVSNEQLSGIGRKENVSYKPYRPV